MNNTHRTWPAKPWILALFLALAGLIYHRIIDDTGIANSALSQGRMALASFVFVAAVIFAFGLEKYRWFWSIIFACLSGAVMAGVSYWAIRSNSGNVQIEFSLWAGVLSTVIALPVFQTLRDQSKFALPYKQLHAYAWNDFVCWCIAFAFVGLSFALALLLAALFNLIGLNFLSTLLKQDWFFWLFIGATFGGALGVLKQNDEIVSSMQSLVMTVLSILAPVLCVGLVVFLLSTLFTGLQPLWDATKNTTPILLGCAFGAVILSNAIIRDEVEQIPNSKILRYSALGLALCVLPLSVIAVVSLQLRLTQYGYTPDRIWGLITVGVVVIYGAIYLVSIVTARGEWMSRIRQTNIWLTIGLCIMALFLALPILDFGAISIKDQLARLEDGRTQAEDFDFVAFAFDFGPEGREVLEKMRTPSDTVLATGAKTALAAEYRWHGKTNIDRIRTAAYIENTLRVHPEQIKLPDSLATVIVNNGRCIGSQCTLIWAKNSDSAQLIFSDCRNYGSLKHSGDECYPAVLSIHKNNQVWQFDENLADFSFLDRNNNTALTVEQRKAFWASLNNGDISIHSVQRKQIYVGGRAIGEVYE